MTAVGKAVRLLAAAVSSAQAFAVLELAAVALIERSRFASLVEAETGSLWLSPTLLVGASLFGLAGGALALVFASEHRRSRELFSGLVGLAGAAMAWGVGGGRHLATLGTRGGFALLVAGLLACAVFWAAPVARRLLRERPGWFAAAAALAILLLELVNRFVLVRLYPAFHFGLSAAALALSPFVTLPWALALAARARRAPRPLFAAPALAVALALLVPWSAEHLARYDNYRLVVSEHAPVAGRAVELAALVSPPEPWDDPCDDASGEGACAAAPPLAGGRSVDWRGRSLLLVTVDALRADHVGAYGYSRPTTPEIDRLAREGAVFERAYTATPHTSYAIASLMTGKYMRPLLQLGSGADSDTWAGLFRTYGYRTAAFYPPAVFFIDPANFEALSRRGIDFEYRWVEFAEGATRLNQVSEYLGKTPDGAPLFMWVHLFGPHEPYEAHPEHPFGERDVDRYDSEIAKADATLGAVVRAFTEKRPDAAVIVTADHGEEFGDHGGRYHGTSVYEEQVRVPLVVWAPGAIEPQRVRETVGLVDLLPTSLSALDIPRPPRLRGRDLGPLLAGRRPPEAGMAHAETEERALYAEGSLRLVCERRLGACQLFDVESDPKQRRDIASERPSDRDRLKSRLRELSASHGRFELGGLRAEGKGWPPAIRRGLSGDGEAVLELAELLDDADVAVRRKAAEVLFELRRPEAVPALRLAFTRDEDADVRSWSALALTRLGQGVPLVTELLTSPNLTLRRLSALALAESGDKRGAPFLIEWWQDPKARDFERSRQILSVFAELGVSDAAWPLVKSLDDVRLRPYVAKSLARVGDEAAVGPLLRAFADERLQSTRTALAEALVELGAKEELALPLRRFLGVPDPLPNGVELALRAGILEHVGGPAKRDLAKLRRNAGLGQAVRVVVPPGGNGQGVRAIVRAKSAGAPGEVLVSSGAHLITFDREGNPKRKRGVPELDPERVLRLRIPASDQAVEVTGRVPDALGLKPGRSSELIVYATAGVALEAVSFVPLADELGPPAPEPWKPEKGP